MNFEHPMQKESVPISKMEVEAEFEDFVPATFKEDPFRYFDIEGKNIKSGEIEYDETGRVKEDPTATKDFPTWKNKENEELHVVAKKVNTAKSHVGKSGDPFYEYTIMEIAEEFNLPAPKPIVKVQRENDYLIVMEKVTGIRWTDSGMKPIHEANLTDAEKQDLLQQAEDMMSEIAEKYEAIGLYRKWKLKDMIFDVDIPNRKVLRITPTDWERTKINKDALERAQKERSGL